MKTSSPTDRIQRPPGTTTALSHPSCTGRGTGSAGYAYVISTIAAVGGLLFGFDTAIIAGADEFVKRDFQLAAHPHVEGFVVSSLLVGCMIGAGLAGPLSDRAGRKKVLVVSAAMYLISAVLSALPRTVAELTAARFLGGLAVGVSSMVAPMYIAEVAPARIRGRLVTLNQMAIVSGILLANLVSLFLVDAASNWRLMFASAAMPAFVFLVALAAVPESPRWLARQRQDTRALEILSRVNGPARAALELEQIHTALTQEEGSFAELLRPGLRVALVIGVTLAVLGQVSGINSIIYYAPKIFLAAGLGEARAAMFATVMVGLTNFVSTIVSMWVIDKIGRKSLLMMGTAGMTISLVLAGAWLPSPSIPMPVKIAIVLAYIAAFGVGVGGVVWVVIAEIFPNKVRGRGAATATVAVWTACFLVAQTFPFLIATLSHRVFWIYAVMSAAMFLFTWQVVPETKGRTLEEIEKMWRGAV